MFKVLIADNEQIYVNGMEEVFESLPSFQICGIVQDVDSLTEVCQRIKPDLVITRTFYFYKNTTFTAVAKLKKQCPYVKVLMMLDTNKLADLEKAVDVGTDACILRSASTLEFISAMQRVMLNQPVTVEVAGGNAWGPEKVPFNKVELGVVLQLCQNLSYEQMAANLGTKADKLEQLIAAMLAKTKHRNSLGLIFEAIHKGYGYSWRAEVG